MIAAEKGNCTVVCIRSRVIEARCEAAVVILVGVVRFKLNATSTTRYSQFFGLVAMSVVVEVQA